MVLAALAALGGATSAHGKGFAYVAGFTDTVAAHTIGADGSLSPNGTQPTGNTPRSVAVSPDAKHAYVSNFGGGSVSGYDIQANGTLTPVPNSPFTAGSNAEGLAITPDGKFLYVAAQGAAAIHGFAIGADGGLTPVPDVSFTVIGLQEIAISGNGKFIYATAGTQVFEFSIDPDGSLTQVGLPEPTPPGAKGIVSTPDGSVVFVISQGANQIAPYTAAADGSLTLVATSLVPAGGVPQTPAVTPDGRFIYVTNSFAANTVTAYSIGAGGVLTAVPSQPFTTSAVAGVEDDAPYGIDAAPNGRLYVSNFGNGIVDPPAETVSVLSIAGDGGLSAPVTFPAGLNGPEYQSIATTPNQGPTAAVTATAAPPGQPTAFNASGSTDPDGGTVTRYDWDFGDGQTLADGGPTPTHTYTQAGTYTASVTVTDDEGCSNSVIFTGQTADCNGGAAATASTQVVVQPGAVELKLSGKKTQKLDAAIEVGAACDVACAAAGSGKLIVTTPSGGGKAALKSSRKTFKIKKVTKQVSAGGKVTLKLKLSKKARAAATKALNNGGKAVAKLTVTATTASGNTDRVKRSVKLVKKR
jgi:6-phosphogluconolactonase (cycloisomerase 2 family)